MKVSEWIQEGLLTAGRCDTDAIFDEEWGPVVDMLLEGEYTEVMDMLATEPAWVDSEALEKQHEEYRLLGQYFLNGTEDPERERFYRQIGRALFEMLVNLKKNKSRAEEQTAYRPAEASTQLLLNPNLLPLTTLLPRLAHEELTTEGYFERVDMLFDYLWTTTFLSAEEEALLRPLLLSEGEELLAQVAVAALFLATYDYLDARKLQLLIDTIDHSAHPRAKGAALVALLILGNRYGILLSTFYPELVAQAHKVLVALPKSTLLQAFKTINITFHTRKMHRVYQEEILPEIEAASAQLMSKMNFAHLSAVNMLEELQSIKHSDDLYEVVELLEETQRNFKKRFTAYSDEAYHLFYALKKDPFFRQASHWFMPFSQHHPAVKNVEAREVFDFESYVAQGYVPCSSDLYSIALSFATGVLPTAQREEFVAALKMQFMDGNFKEIDAVEAGMRDLIFGAFRFFELSSFNLDSIAPFNEELVMLSNPLTDPPEVVGPDELWAIVEVLKEMELFYLMHLPLSLLHSKFNDNSATLWRTAAAVALVQDAPQYALPLLLRATEVEGITPITAKKITQLKATQESADEVLSWIEKCEQQIKLEEIPEVALHKAKMLSLQNRYQEALQAAYLYHYVQGDKDANDASALLFITKLLLQLHRPEEALAKLNTIPQVQYTNKVWAIKGVATIALGKWEEGVDYLQTAIDTTEEEDYVEVRLAMNLLKNYGKQRWEIVLLYDLLTNFP